jgi:hypothetical protein
MTAILAAGLSGCCHTQPAMAPRPTVTGFGPCGCAPVPQGRLSPTPGGPILNVPPANGLPPDPQPVIPPGGQQRSFLPPNQTFPPPPANGGQFQQPPLDPNRSGARLLQPQIGETPSVPENKGEPPTLPADIPNFALARKNVATGHKPFPEGLNWLRDKGYRAVLHIRPPNEDDSAARRQFTAKGFIYLSLEVSPRTLSRDIVEEFNRIVTDPANLPLYVYDRDSSLAGGLWYLHFRLVEGYPDEKATVEAARLGLNPDADGGPHKEMWIAVQNYLRMPRPQAKRTKIASAVWLRSPSDLP